MNTRKKKIHINGRFLFAEHPTGTHRSAELFAEQIIRKLADRYVVIIWGNRNWRRFSNFLLRTGANYGAVPYNSAWALQLWEQLIFPKLSKGGMGINLIGTAPALGKVENQLMLVHDCNSVIDPKSFSFLYRLWSKLAKYHALRRCGHVICVSKFVKNSVMQLYRTRREPVVVYQGPGLRCVENTASILDHSQRSHFLCVGSVLKHKNVEGIVRSWILSNLWKTECELVVVGKERKHLPSLSYLLQASELQRYRIRFSGFVSDEDLYDLYRRAYAVIYPSFHEGFGLPIVEAFHSGTPVITSNISCMPEIAGDSAILVSPSSDRSIADAITKLKNDIKFWNFYRSCGIARSKQFSWERAGEEFSNHIANVFKYYEK